MLESLKVLCCESLSVWKFELQKKCECLEVWMFDILNVESLSFWKFGFSKVWMFESFKVRVLESLSFESLSVWKFECLQVVVFESLVFWKFDALSFWKFEFLKVWNIASPLPPSFLPRSTRFLTIRELWFGPCSLTSSARRANTIRTSSVIFFMCEHLVKPIVSNGFDMGRQWDGSDCPN